MKKFRQETEERETDYQSKIRKHKFVFFYRIVLAAMIIIAVFAILITQYKNKVYSEYEVTASAARESATNAVALNLDGMILTYSNDGANCSDTKGRVVWNETFEMQSPIIDTCQNTVAIGDYNGQLIYIMDTTGAIGQISTIYPVKSFSVSANGVVAAVLEDTDITWIYVYDKDGNTLVQFRTTMAQSGYPISVDISPNGILLTLSYLYVDSGEVKSSVAFYNFGEVGQNEGENYVSGYDYSDTVVPYVQFMNDSMAFAVADNRLMFYKGTQKPVMNAEVLIDSEIQSVYFNNDYVGIVTLDTTGNMNYMLSLYTPDGSLVLNQGVEIDYNKMILSKDIIYVYNDAECAIYNIKGIEKYKGSLDGSIGLIIPGVDASKFTVVTKEMVENISLK